LSELSNPKEILELLDKSNCRECGEKTCLAFAGAVFRGQRSLDECPKLDRETLEGYSVETGGRREVDENREEYLKNLKKEVANIDLEEAAERVGGRFSGNKMTLRIMGKNFSVDKDGKLFADIHVNPWVAVPFLNYVLYAPGAEPTGNWASFRELEGGRERYPLFQKRCEEAIKKLADQYTDFFDDIIHMFSGKKVDAQFESDISVVLYPLPLVPFMICYWKPEEGLGSGLNVYFDETADENLDIGSIFTLGTGIAQMFEKLAMRHGFVQ
jgi:hypothetical protein